MLVSSEGHLPFQDGGRFSMKAVRPSLVSSLAITSAKSVLVSFFRSSSDCHADASTT